MGEINQTRVAKLIGDLIPVSLENHMPLQAADLLCWHIQRHHAGNNNDEDCNNAERLSKAEITYKNFDADELDGFVNGLLDIQSEQKKV